VRYALDTWPQLRLLPPTLRLSSPGLTSPQPQSFSGAPHALPPAESGPGESGKRSWDRYTLLTAEEAALVQRFDPDGPEDTMGFFIAVFEKTDSTL